jgi:hypothetical protein
MLTTLSTVKARLALDPLDPTHDALLQRAIIAISARFDQETNRILARTENVVFEFPIEDTQIVVPCYPIESVSKFEIKSSETQGWLEQTGVQYILRRRCIISLSSAFSLQPSGLSSRVTYTGGYMLPDASDPQPSTPNSQLLPVELEQAAVEQTAFWFQTKDQLGLIRQWPKGGNYEQFADPDLLPSVREVLRRYTRFVL